MVARCIDDTPNSLSCGIVWFVDILSVYCRSCLLNELGVRDPELVIWNVGSILIDIFQFAFLADEMFLEQRRYTTFVSSTSALAVGADHGSQEGLGEIPPFRDVGQSPGLLTVNRQLTSEHQEITL